MRPWMYWMRHASKALEMHYWLIQVYSNLATAYNIAGNNDKAISVLDRLIELEPEYARAHYLHGLLAHEMGDPNQAIKDLQLAIKYDANNFRYHYNLSNMYYQSGELKKAESVISVALRINPSDQSALQLHALITQRK